MLARHLRDEIDRLTKSREAELIGFRRERHRYPELGRNEHVTTAALVERLHRAGLSPRVLSCGTGVVCDIIGSDGATPTVGFRADIDALPLPDVKDVPYRSQVEGLCHACGHDVHTAIVLGAALVLAEMRDAGLLAGSARFIFQPAEELSPGGALDVIRDGEIASLEHVFALHCDPKVEVGRVAFRSGPITAGADRIRVRLGGSGGHTARPHLTADVVFALGAVITTLPALLSRLADPRAGLSLVWGQVHAGGVANAIPQSGYVEGTIRSLDTQTWETAHRIVPDLVRAVAAPYGVTVDVDVHKSVPPCVNTESSTDHMRDVATEMLGAEAITATEQSLGGEDFAWILNRTNGSLARLGVRRLEAATASDLHQGTFDADEGAIAVGVRLLCALAVSPLPA